jgi:hypothetical protein
MGKIPGISARQTGTSAAVGDYVFRSDIELATKGCCIFPARRSKIVQELKMRKRRDKQEGGRMRC